MVQTPVSHLCCQQKTDPVSYLLTLPKHWWTDDSIFGSHLCRMLIHSKTIRSGYKNWVLCGHDGYPYQVHKYQSHENYPKVGALETKVVNSLCNVIENMENHEVCFDNLFTSIPPLEFMWLQLDLNPEPLSS